LKLRVFRQARNNRLSKAHVPAPKPARRQRAGKGGAVKGARGGRDIDAA